MLILVFSGIIALAELCALSWHETRRNQRSDSYLERENYWYRYYLREAAERQLAPVFPTPVAVSSRETLEVLGLLQNRSTGNLRSDLADRLM